MTACPEITSAWSWWCSSFRTHLAHSLCIIFQSAQRALSGRERAKRPRRRRRRRSFAARRRGGPSLSLSSFGGALLLCHPPSAAARLLVVCSSAVRSVGKARRPYFPRIAIFQKGIDPTRGKVRGMGGMQSLAGWLLHINITHQLLMNVTNC